LADWPGKDISKVSSQNTIGGNFSLAILENQQTN